MPKCSQLHYMSLNMQNDACKTHFLCSKSNNLHLFIVWLHAPTFSSTRPTVTPRLQPAAPRVASRPPWKKDWASASLRHRTWSFLCQRFQYHWCALCSCLRTAQLFPHQSRPWGQGSTLRLPVPSEPPWVTSAARAAAEVAPARGTPAMTLSIRLMRTWA